VERHFTDFVAVSGLTTIRLTPKRWALYIQLARL